ncbi:MAG: NUDIX hydrolase [Gemmatimonadaceae bacterium]
MNNSARVSSRRVYTGRVLNLDIDRVRFPDGSQGDLEIVRHSGASAVVPLLDDPSHADPGVVLIRQYRYAAEGYVYEVPAGRLDKEESPATCAHRELEEETGYRAAHMKPLISAFTTPGFTDERIHLFLAWGLTSGQERRERDEFLTSLTLPLSQVLMMIRRGEINDAKTVVALLYVAAFRRDS